MSTDLVPVPYEQRRCALYRHYDAREVLLYVGISESLGARTEGHARSSQWVQYATSAEAEWFPSRVLAEAAERRAIQTEEPVFNRQWAVGDIDGRIAAYVREHQAREQHAALAFYEAVVARFIDAAPAEVRRRAEERARGFYEYAGVVPDRLFPARVLSWMTDSMNEVLDEAMDGAEAKAYVEVRDFIEEREQKLRAEIRARRDEAAGQERSEAPF